MRLTVGRPARRGGYVIFAVLIVVVVLALVAYRFAESMTAEYRAGVRTADNAQAKLAAVSGLHYAAAVLSDRDTFANELDGNPFDNPDVFERIEVAAAAGGTASPRSMYFDIRAVVPTGGGSFEQRFGVIDEGGKLNINSLIALDKTGAALFNALMKLPNMTEDVADAIVDWVDADDISRTSGAESSYYLSLSNAYQAKNGPLVSLDELLLVRGVTPELLHGGDRNRNGVQDEGETGGDRGWSDYLTVYGRELNIDKDGVKRIFLNSPLSDLTYLDTLSSQLPVALGEELASFILAYRLYKSSATPSDANGNLVDASGNPASPASGTTPRTVVKASPEQVAEAVQKALIVLPQGQLIVSLSDLMNIRIQLPPSEGLAKDADLFAVSPLNNPTNRAALLALLLDKTTVKKEIELVPRINVNTAPSEVLLGIPTMTADEVDAILDARGNTPPTDPETLTGAWLVAGAAPPLTAARFKQVEKYITGTTMVYRVQAVGYSAGGTLMARMEAVIDTNQGAPRFLHIRDLSDLENPRGFQPSAPQQ